MKIAKSLFLNLRFAFCILCAVWFVPAAVPVVYAENQPLEIHKFKFFLHPDLTTSLSDETVANLLVQYVEDLNIIFSKQTIRRFSFNPLEDIILTETKPQTDYATHPLPQSGYEIWAWAQKSDLGYSYGGYAGIDVSGAGVAAELYWDTIYDRSTLTAGSEELSQYWIQIDHMVHEIEHIFGAGTSEYYNLAIVNDTTGVEPIQNISIFEPSDPYWSRHTDFFGDPLLRIIWDWNMVGNPTSHEALMEVTRFAQLTVAVINDPLRRGFNWPETTIPDLTHTQIQVFKDSDGAPLSGALIKIWKVRSFSPYVNELIVEGETESNGVFEFFWDTAFNNYEHLSLVKVYAEGYLPKAIWVSIFDAQEQKMVFSQDQMIIELPLAEHVAADFDGDGDVDGSDLADLINNFTAEVLAEFTLSFGRVN